MSWQSRLSANSNGKATTVTRAPWIVAGLFGLLHGLGFAGALAEVGLPAHEIPAALFSFNVGIEVGQLLFVAVVLLAWSALQALPIRWPEKSIYVPTYRDWGLGGILGLRAHTRILTELLGQKTELPKQDLPPSSLLSENTSRLAGPSLRFHKSANRNCAAKYSG